MLAHASATPHPPPALPRRAGTHRRALFPAPRLRPPLAAALLLALLAPPLAADDVPITGPAQPGLEPFDKLMLDFVAQHQVPGAALAVTRNGRLVYARGFGWADREAGQKVEPASLFRLASVSKPITAVTVLRLLDDGKLRLDDHAFELLRFAPLVVAGAAPDPRLDRITILELLQHRGGFDRDKSLDPMAQSVDFARLCGVRPPALQPEIIRVMEGRPLDFAPGERYAYSNFGYCVLGRVIEQVTGLPYETYVLRNVLAPLGIAHMQIGHTLLRSRAPGEVKYYTAKADTADAVFPPLGRKVPAPYGGFCLEAMDSHGGWLASAPDIVRFASALDDPKASGILKPMTAARLFERPPGAAGLVGDLPGGKPADAWYGCGWQVRDAGNGRVNSWHTGMLAGTSTLLVRRADGLDWAVLFNQDADPQGNNLADQIDPLVHRAADAVKRWPDGIDRAAPWP